MVRWKGRAVLIGIVIGLLPAPGQSADAPQFTAEEKAWIAAHPVVRTRIDAKWRPFEFRENGKVVGVVPSFLDAVAKISGLRFEYVDDVAWRDSLEALRSGRIDIIPDIPWRSVSDIPDPRPAGAVSGTIARGDTGGAHSEIIITRPYFVGTVSVVGPEHLSLFISFRDLAGRRVAIKGGGALEAAIRHGNIPVTLLTYEDERDALAAVSDGNADVAIGPDLSILPLIQRQYRNKLFVTGGLPDTAYALAIATRRDMAVLASILDKSLVAISARDAETITQQWIQSADYGKPSLRSILYYRRWQVVAAGASLLALVVITFASWRSRVAAVRSERDKAMFFAFISHEIRTPMQTILSSLELLQRSQLPPNQADRADAAIAASESLLTLLDDILEYARLESHNLTLAPEPTRVVPWIQRSADMVRWRVDEKRLSLALELACPPGLCVLIDPVRTRQIVLNLLVNAIKFTSAGSVTLRVDYLEGKRESAGSLVLEVRDTGIGIAPEYQRRIFEHYQRVEHAGNRRVSGSGLGLAICRSLVDLMKGVVTVSSSSDKGTIFTVILPARRMAHTPSPAMADTRAATAEPVPPEPAQESPNSGSPPPADGGPLILVVDDHEAVQHAIRHQLDAFACRSVVAGTGAQALAQFAGTAFDMVLLDCDLPDIDGYTVVQRMRDDERQWQRTRTPIIAISASTGDAHRERCFDSGMDGVLCKPLRLDVLREMIALWCPVGPPGAAGSPTEQPRTAKPDLHAIYRHSVDADLAALDDALAKGDVERARHASHRITGAAAIAGHVVTSKLAAELEHRLQFVAGGIPPAIRALGEDLLRIHRADMGEPDA
ncbi:ATP-binding protein [Burkholderia sp. Tr-20390]|uniref:ATP-binding protein n=1 Tax=Burkholderia sp. Tr-20390 TaxID=2703904 RepID=UPI0019801D4E|nr:ATP-binding protein [Burkholderia sp. Tr-20390]MBN3734945.1 transporter substrate-binding domain-containing protein [Burkholderia sp. Tr-20390]